MIGHSVPEYVFIRVSILCLRAIAPLSLFYVVYSIFFRLQGIPNTLVSDVGLLYAVLEASFYLFVYLPRVPHLQEPAAHPPLLSRRERQILFSKCFARIRDSELATGWFHPSPTATIKKGNVVQWLLWALFYTHQDHYQKEWEDELTDYVNALEGLLGHELEAGLDEQVRSMRITLDPVVTLHRPFVWYLAVWVIDAYSSFSLYRGGFRHYSGHHWFSHFPLRMLPGFSHTSPHPQISYWYRPHNSTTKQPVVFLHGIGIGLWTYCPFLFEVIVADPEVGILAIENLNISMRMSPPPLDRADMLSAFTSILDHHGLSNVVISGHSYGTVLAAHILRDPALSARVTAWQLVDPIPFMLHLPAVAYNFVYRKPRSANEWQLWYFASRDPDIARFLSRHFFWPQNILWKDDIEGKFVGIVLSGEDQIVNVMEVWQYLTGAETTVPRWKQDKLEILFCPGIDHSQVFDTKQSRLPLIRMLMDFCSGDDKH